MSQQHKIGTHKTTVKTENGCTIVRYHETDIVKFSDKYIILDNGGWFTATTKTRMNQTSNQFCLNFSVFQKNGDWFIAYDGIVVPYVNGIVINRL